MSAADVTGVVLVVSDHEWPFGGRIQGYSASAGEPLWTEEGITLGPNADHHLGDSLHADWSAEASRQGILGRSGNDRFGGRPSVRVLDPETGRVLLHVVLGDSTAGR